MTKSIYFNVPARSMFDSSLDEFVRSEAKRSGVTRAAIIRQAVAALRERRRREDHENHLRAVALHRKIEAEVDRVGAFS